MLATDSSINIVMAPGNSRVIRKTVQPKRKFQVTSFYFSCMHSARMLRSVGKNNNDCAISLMQSCNLSIIVAATHRTRCLLLRPAMMRARVYSCVVYWRNAVHARLLLPATTPALCTELLQPTTSTSIGPGRPPEGAVQKAKSSPAALAAPAAAARAGPREKTPAYNLSLSRQAVHSTWHIRPIAAAPTVATRVIPPRQSRATDPRTSLCPLCC